jgi:DNA-binding transcriptional LysR family regulator
MTLRLGYVAGVSPGRWLRTWNERHRDLPLEATRVDEAVQLDALLAGDHDVAFVRLPVPEQNLHAIPLWDELAVVVLPKEHPLAEADALALADLAEEPAAPVQPDAALTVELVAAGTGYAIMPHGVARLHHRRDVVAIPVTDAPVTRIALVWRVDRDDADIQELVGIVRGRTARSSRGAEAEDETAAQQRPAGKTTGATGKSGSKTGAKPGAKGGTRGHSGRGSGKHSGKNAGKRSGKGRRR